jgi:hypothetical protein
LQADVSHSACLSAALLRRLSKTRQEAVDASAATKMTERSLRAAPEEQSIQQQQDHGADD